MAQLLDTSLFNDSALVAYYKFEGNSNDSKGSNNGSDTSITYSSGNGKFGQGAGGDGSTSKITIAGSGLNIASPLSVSLWLNADSSGSGTGQFALSSDPNNTVSIQYNYTDSKYIFGASTSGEGYAEYAQSGTTSKDAWHLVQWQYDGSTLKGYVDLTEVVSQARTGSLNSYDANAWRLFTYDTGSLFYKGKMDDLAFLSKSLSANERAELYNDVSGGFIYMSS